MLQTRNYNLRLLQVKVRYDGLNFATFEAPGLATWPVLAEPPFLNFWFKPQM